MIDVTHDPGSQLNEKYLRLDRLNIYKSDLRSQ